MRPASIFWSFLQRNARRVNSSDADPSLNVNPGYFGFYRPSIPNDIEFIPFDISLSMAAGKNQALSRPLQDHRQLKSSRPAITITFHGEDCGLLFEEVSDSWRGPRLCKDWTNPDRPDTATFGLPAESIGRGAASLVAPPSASTFGRTRLMFRSETWREEYPLTQEP